MKKRTDFVTNSSSMSWIMALLFGLPIGLGVSCGCASAYAGQSLGLTSATPGPATAPQPQSSQTTSTTQQPPKPPRSEVAWSGEAYILDGSDAITWLTDRGLIKDGFLTSDFWNQWDAALVREGQKPPFGLQGVAGDWSRDRDQPVGHIAIMVDQPGLTGGAQPGPKPDGTTADQTPQDGDAGSETPGDQPDQPHPALNLLQQQPEQADEVTPPPGDQPPVDEPPVDQPPVEPPPEEPIPPVALEEQAPPATPEESAKPPETPEEKPDESPPPEPPARVQQLQQLLDDKVEDRDKLQGLNIEWQLNVTGPSGGTYRLTIEGGKATVSEGVSSNPSVVVTMPEEIYTDAMAGDIGIFDIGQVINNVSVQDDGSLMQTVDALGVKINPLFRPFIEAIL